MTRIASFRATSRTASDTDALSFVFWRKVRRKICLTAAIFLFLCSAVFPQGQEKYALYYYGVVTNVNDQNMLNMTQDLFAAQIRGIGYVSLRDMHSDGVKALYADVSTDTDGSEFFSLVKEMSPDIENAILFYTRIFRPRSDEKWECTFFAKNTQNDVVASRTKSYDSYYKILSDAKQLIQSVVAEACGKSNEPESSPNGALAARPNALNAENISGTWSGESDISKIILMRSGRGFIVFANGATMNISISLSGEAGSKRLRVVQQDKFNASYYPDIDRGEILSYAENAAPIEWNLVMMPNGNLEGTKKTLVASVDGIEPSDVKVVWKKSVR